MSIDLSHLLDPYRARALLPNEERIQWIKQDRWIHYSRAERVLDCLTALLHYPPRDRMPCLLLFGATGMGKTSLVQKFLRDYRSSFDAGVGRTRLPVVSIQMPPAPNERDFYEEVLASMGGVLVAGISITTLRHRTRILARQLEVHMLIIDEIHSILAGTFREQRILLNAIRFLANDLRIPIVCVGTHDAKQALMTDQQLADRFEAMELPPWEDDATFQQLLCSFGAILPLRKSSNLIDSKLRKRVLSLSEGVLVRICRLLESAVIVAIQSEVDEAARTGDPCYIPAVWSLALLTRCRVHLRPLQSECPVCLVEEPLLFPSPPKSGFFCRSCGFDFSVKLIRERPAPRINAVMALEDAYISAVHGRAPDPQWLSEISSTGFRKLVESLVILFSSRLASETHILAVFLLDREVVERYHFCRHAAEAKLAYFSWHWRFAVIFSIAKVIFGKRGDPTRSALCPDSSEVFFELLRNLPWEDHFHIIVASRTWPARLQDEFGLAMKRLERRAWASKRNPA